MTVSKFIGVKAQYDQHGQLIFGVDAKGGLQRLVDVLGWGAIQNLFKDGSGKVDMQKAGRFQDEVGQWLVDAINEKLEREKNN